MLEPLELQYINVNNAHLPVVIGSINHHLVTLDRLDERVGRYKFEVVVTWI